MTIRYVTAEVLEQDRKAMTAEQIARMEELTTKGWEMLLHKVIWDGTRTKVAVPIQHKDGRAGFLLPTGQAHVAPRGKAAVRMTVNLEKAF